MIIEQKVAQWISDTFGVSEEALTARIRHKNVAQARHVFCGVLRKAECSYPAIARFLGRDHTTIMHSVGVCENDESIKILVQLGYEHIRAFMEERRSKISGIWPVVELNPINKHGKGFSETNRNRWSEVYSKYDGRCAVCGFSEVVEVHHIVSRAMGGSDMLSNLILVCPNHHSMIDRGLIFIKDIHKKFEDYASLNKG